MKRGLHILALLLFSSGLFAQTMTLEPDVFEYTFSEAAEEIKIGYTFNNDTDSVIEWAWAIQKEESFPKDWEIQVCDQTLCWGFGTEAMPDGALNMLDAGASTTPSLQYVLVRNNGVAGTGKLQFCTYSSHDYDSDPLVCSQFSGTSVADTEIDDVQIYPNPASDYFQVSDNSKVKSIELFNIVGKRVATYSQANGAAHDISDLRNGLYVARMMDGNGQLVKSVRLSKR